MYMEPIQKQSVIDDFSTYLFWDVDKVTLDMEKHAAYIIKRVLEYGQWSDWCLIRDFYTIPVIATIVRSFRGLDERALSYIATVSHTPIEQFRCYSIQQSNPPHLKF